MMVRYDSFNYSKTLTSDLRVKLRQIKLEQVTLAQATYRRSFAGSIIFSYKNQ